MKRTHQFQAFGQCPLQVTIQASGEQLTIAFQLASAKPTLLHWGVGSKGKEGWQQPPPACWPADSRAADPSSLDTPMVANSQGHRRLELHLPYAENLTHLYFVLFQPEEKCWENNRGQNFALPLPAPGESLVLPAQLLAEELGEAILVHKRNYRLAADRELAVQVSKDPDALILKLVTNQPGALLLHWGLATGSSATWQAPAPALCPAGSTVVGTAVQTPFIAKQGLNRLNLRFPLTDPPPGLVFVLHQPESGGWLKDRQQNFFVSFHPPTSLSESALGQVHPELVQRIIDAETGRNSWTLMHRYNLASELLGGLSESVDGWALLFVWLRYSAIRQLVWQKNFNTKPAELAHAQRRFTLEVASSYHDQPPATRALIRLILSTVGRGGVGGKGQRIRDDILHIMHRHKIKEVSGHFMEEWHQKLHNNTTPDDIGICEAYLGFLYHYGDLGVFYKILGEAGISKERLTNFERPIRSEPDFVPYLRDGLIHDFENFLKLLKSVHSATDLQSAIQQAEPWLSDHMRQRVWQLQNQAGDRSLPLLARVGELTAIREDVNRQLEGERESERIRDLLYLDLGLEDYLRTVAESTMYDRLSEETLVHLLGLLVTNVCLSHADPELALGGQHWRRLEAEHGQNEWSLHGLAVLDRLTRTLAHWVDGYDRLLQGKAEYLGQAFKAAPWTIEIFNQEVVRARSGFVLAAVIKMLEPELRRQAGSGSWQLISQEDGVGKVLVAPLASIQNRTFTTPRVVISETIGGDEEIPRGVVAVLTVAGVDILSHVAIRARNAKILFASCYDPQLWTGLKEMNETYLSVQAKANGELSLTPVSEKEAILPQTGTEPLKAPQPRKLMECAEYLLAAKDFQVGLVGGKSNNMARLLRQKPDWLAVPPSVAIPFGVCERVLAEVLTPEEQVGYEALLAQLEKGMAEALPPMRELILALPPSPPLLAALRSGLAAEKMSAELRTDEDWHLLWLAIKQVWASKWNERAFWSRRKWSIRHRDLLMAVLIQPTVKAEYAFVIHTRNPLNDNPDELYAEVMPGLGETICSGNYPGRAFSFRCPKAEPLRPVCLSYPSKGMVLRGGGLIIRSDSNGEDLEGYAGAGLYDSVLLRPTTPELVDYTKEALFWESGKRQEMMIAIAKLGLAIEAVMGGEAQDIEGAYAGGQYTVVQTRPQV